MAAHHPESGTRWIATGLILASVLFKIFIADLEEGIVGKMAAFGGLRSKREDPKLLRQARLEGWVKTKRMKFNRKKCTSG